MSQCMNGIKKEDSERKKCPENPVPQCDAGTSIQKKTDADGCVYYYCLATATQTTTTQSSCPTQTMPTCKEGETRNYTCTSNKKVEWCSCIGNSWKCIEAPEKRCGTLLNECKGCIVGKECLPFGTRLVPSGGVPLYCHTDYSNPQQKSDGSACQNNYECLSNSCGSGVCINLQEELSAQRNILEQILGWLSKLFGFNTKQ